MSQPGQVEIIQPTEQSPLKDNDGVNPAVCTIMLQNLSTKASNMDILANLEMLLGRYGCIVALNAGGPLRGHAFCAYGAAADAERAVRQLNGRQFMGRELNVSFALSESKKFEKMCVQTDTLTNAC